MGLIYATNSMSHSWEGIMQNVPWVTLGMNLCNSCFAQILDNSIHNTIREGIMQTEI